jgi:ankyrin repeat protein
VAGQLSTVQLLLDRGGNLSARNIHGGDTFDFAVGNDRAEIVDTLAGRGVDLKERGGPALLVTASRGGISTATVLLKHGVAVNCRDTSGATPVMRAVASRQRSMVAFLIEHGADVNAADNRGASRCRAPS